MSPTRRKILFLVLVGCLIVAGYIHGKKYITPFGQQLTSSSDSVRYFAYKKLGEMTKEEQQALISEIIPLTSSETSSTRRYALYALRQIGISQDDVISANVERLFDEDQGVYEEAMVSLINFMPSALNQTLLALPKLDEKREETFKNSLLSLNEGLLSPLVAAVKSPVDEIRINASKLLWKLSVAPRESEDSIKPLLLDPLEPVRFYGALTLNKIDSTNKKVIPVLKEALKKDSWGEIQYASLEALSRIGTKASSVSPFLTELLKGKGDGFDGRYPKPEIAKTLHAVKPRPNSIQDIIYDLKHKRPYIRYRAAWYVSEMDTPKRAFVPALVKTVNDSDQTVSARAVYALTRVGFDKAKRFYQRLVPDLIMTIEKANEGKKNPGYIDMVKKGLTNSQMNMIPQTMDKLQKKEIVLQTANEILETAKVESLSTLKPYLSYGQMPVRLLAALHLSRAGSVSDKVKKEIANGLESKNVELASWVKTFLDKYQISIS